MKLACADYSFPLLSHDSVLDLIAALDVEGVDLALMGNRSHIRPEIVRDDLDGWAERIKKALDERGLELADVFVIPWTDFETLAPNHPDESQRQDARALFRDMVTLASRLGAPGMTLLPGIHWAGESWDESFARAVAELEWRVGVAHEHGLRFSIEAHLGSVAETPATALALLKAVPGLGVSLDYTHFVFQGFAEEKIEPLLAYARHFHARGASAVSLQTTLRENTIDYDRVIDLLLEAGYAEYIGIEYVWTPSEPPGSAYDLTKTDNLSETILLRDQIRARVAAVTNS